MDEERRHRGMRVVQVQGAAREHLLKNCPKWKRQQKNPWAEVRKNTGRGKNRFTIQDLFADKRCTRPILDFVRATEVGPRGLPPEPKKRRKEDGGGK